MAAQAGQAAQGGVEKELRGVERVLGGVQGSWAQ